MIGQTIKGEGIPVDTTITSLGSGTLTLSDPVEVGRSGSTVALSGVASTTVTNLTTTTGTFGPGQSITAPGIIPAGTEITGVTQSTLALSKAATASATGAELTATGPQPISASITGLAPATGYVFRASAKKLSGEEAQGPPTTFYTFAAPPTFASCPNDPLRSGEYAGPGQPGALLPDCRSFELASPLAKNGNDVRSIPGFTRVAEDGSAITFGSTFGLPGGAGAQQTPFYQASRGEGQTGWSTTGVLPPASAGDQTSFLVGQLPDLSATYATATDLGSSERSAFFELHRDGTPPTQLTPYVVAGIKSFGFAGVSGDLNTVLIESLVALPQEEGGAPIPGSAAGAPNVYAWDRQSHQLRLASAMNTLAQTEATLAKGAYAGPYNWAAEKLASEGGATGGYYLTDEHAVSEDGSVIFTSRGDGHLYKRINPTAEQSLLDPQGNCTQPDKACTLDISASRRTTPDSAGAQPAAFQAATADGSQVLFTSSEKLTYDANTGPEQPEARIGRATLHGEAAADDEIEEFLPAHAAGVAVDPKGEYVYWADPSIGTIGRAKLEGSEATHREPRFIEPGPVDFTLERPDYPRGGVIPEHVSGESVPRYVAVDENYVYWTSTGPPNSPVGGEPAFYHGSIGRAKLNGGIAEEVKPAFIVGANSPEGIAVNSEYIYWANSGDINPWTSRAPIEGGAPEKFINPFAGGYRPLGVAVDSDHIYISEESNSDEGSISRFLLSGESAGRYDVGVVSSNGIAGLAVDGKNIYWSSRRANGNIGRRALANVGGPCEPPLCESEFLTPEGAVVGLATDGAHLFWSSNGEAPPNPGNDLYRYQPGAGEPLKDLIPDPSGDGAEVLGVLGTSADGSYVYFAANADLDGASEAKPGDCKVQILPDPVGECNIYLYHEGQIDFVARVDANETGKLQSDSVDWLAKARFGFTATNDLEKSSLVSLDGRTLVFMSQRQLTSYDSHGIPEFYRYRFGQQGVTCLTCRPTGEPPRFLERRPTFGSLTFVFINPGEPVGAYRVGFASQDGSRLFFETTEAMVGDDTDGAAGCPEVPVKQSFRYPVCLDVYEWEALGTGSCTAGGPGYSPLNEGCIYLMSPGTDSEPSFFANASASGDDAFIFTAAQLVGEDTDRLRDVYDARVEGGLVSQNQAPIPSCEGEGCKAEAPAAPAFQAPPHFSGPPNPKPKRCQGKHCHHKKQGHKKKGHKKKSKQKSADRRGGRK